MSEIPFAGRPRGAARWRAAMTDVRWSIPAFLLGCLVAGLLLAVVWALAAQRPGYTIGEDMIARITERGLADLFSSDALFAVLVGVLGLAAGIVSWLLFRNLGWWVCVLAVVGAALGAVVVWQVGLLIGGGGFAERLASAQPGDVVPVDLALHALSAMLVAPFMGITPVMLFSAFWPEDEPALPTDAVSGDQAQQD